MEPAKRPTIKGIFAKSHVRGLERERGQEGVRELERRTGRPVNYQNTDDVPISEEVDMLENIVDILSPRPLSHKERAREAGRLHFRNFSTTPLWTLVDSLLGSNPKFILMQSAKIAGYVFQDVEFIAADIGERGVKLTMFNNDYPIEHFQGFLEEFLRAFGHEPNVHATLLSRDRYEYTLHW